MSKLSDINSAKNSDSVKKQVKLIGEVNILLCKISTPDNGRKHLLSEQAKKDVV